MAWGDTEILREEGVIRLLKIECKHNEISYCVIGYGSTCNFTDYTDALEEFNLRWMKAKHVE